MPKSLCGVINGVVKKIFVQNSSYLFFFFSSCSRVFRVEK